MQIQLNRKKRNGKIEEQRNKGPERKIKNKKYFQILKKKRTQKISNKRLF